MPNLFALLDDDDAGDVDAQLARVAAAKAAAKAAAEAATKAAAEKAAAEAEAAAKAAAEKAAAEAAEAEARFYEEHGYYYNDEGRRFYGTNRNVDRRFGNYMGGRGAYGGGRGRGEYRVSLGGKGYRWVEKKAAAKEADAAAEDGKDKPVEGGDHTEQGSKSKGMTDQTTGSPKPEQGASETAATSGETKPEDGAASVQASEEAKSEQESSEQASEKKKSKKKKNKKVNPKQPAYDKKQEGPEEPDNSLTLDVYEKLLQEKRKALEAQKTEVRKVVAAKEFDGMTVVGKKIQEEDFIKLQKSEEVKKLKQKESLDEKQEKAKEDSKKLSAPKVVSINEFLRGYGGLRGGGRGYNGGYNDGNRGAYSGGRVGPNGGYRGGYSGNGGYRGGYSGNDVADGGDKGIKPVGRDIVPNGGDSGKASPDVGHKPGESVVHDAVPCKGLAVVPNGESGKGQSVARDVIPNDSVGGGGGGEYRRGGSGYSGRGGANGGSGYSGRGRANGQLYRGGYGYSGRGGANGGHSYSGRGGANRGYEGGPNREYSGRGGGEGRPVESPAARVVKANPAHSFEDPTQFPALK